MQPNKNSSDELFSSVHWNLKIKQSKIKNKNKAKSQKSRNLLRIRSKSFGRWWKRAIDVNSNETYSICHHRIVINILHPPASHRCVKKRCFGSRKNPVQIRAFVRTQCNCVSIWKIQKKKCVTKRNNTKKVVDNHIRLESVSIEWVPVVFLGRLHCFFLLSFFIIRISAER